MGETLPADYRFHFSANFEEIFLNGDGGAKLNALHFKLPQPRGVVLYFHGNAGELSSWGEVVQKFVHRQYDVLVMDYRGYGKSTGEISEEALYADADLFYQYLLKEYPQDMITVYGRSLGTTFATYVAAGHRPRQLILEAPFFSLEQVAQERFPIYPVKSFLKIHFPTYKFIEEVRCPVTIFHGKDDRTVPFENSLELQKLIQIPKVKFVPLPHTDHNDISQTETYRTVMDSIL